MENYLQIQVGMRFKDLRDCEGVSRENFALRIGMDRSYLASIETGRRNVTLLNLTKIARGFEISLADFFEASNANGEPGPRVMVNPFGQRLRNLLLPRELSNARSFNHLSVPTMRHRASP